MGVESIEVLRYADRTEHGESALAHYLSLGMSRYPMTDPSEQLRDDAAGPRAELLLSARGRPDEIWRQLAVLAAAPMVEGVVYAVGNSVDLGHPLLGGSRCTGALLAEGPLRLIPTGATAEIQVLRVIPATANELAWARVHGSAKLIERWRVAAIDLEDLMRESVGLD